MPGLTGIGNAIIVIRGVDLLSKQIGTMSTKYANAVKQIQKANAKLVAQGLPVPASAKFDEAINRAGLSISRFREKWQGLGSTASATGLMMTAALTGPILTALAGATKLTIDYERSLRNIQSIGRQTDAQLQVLSQRFQTMSTNLKKTIATPMELAEAFYEIQSAAFYGADAQKILDASTMAATAGLADQVQTAQAVSMALRAYNDSADSATYYTDNMVRAVDIGVFRFEDLTQQMGDFIGAAGMLKVPFEDVMAAMTTMTKRGIKPSEAATSLNRILMTYLKPSNKQKDLAEILGIDLSGKTLKQGLGKALEDVWKKTGGNEDLIAELFSEMRGVRGAFALLSDGLSIFNTDLEILKRSAGSVREIFDIQTKSFSAQLQNLKNNIMVVGIALGEYLLPLITEFIKTTLTPIINQFMRLDKAARGTIVKIGLALAVVGPALIAFGSLINMSAIAMGALVKPIMLVAGFVTRLGGGLLAIKAGFAAAAGGGAALGTILSGVGSIIATLAGAFVVIGAVAAAATVGFYMWKENTLGLADGLTELTKRGDAIGSLAVQLEAIFSALDRVGFAENWTVAFKGMEDGVDIAALLGNAFKFLAGIVIEVKRNVQALYLKFGILGEYGKLAGIVISSGFALVVESIKGVLVGVLHLAAALSSLIYRDFSGAAEHAQTGLGMLFDTLKDIKAFGMGATPEVALGFAKHTKQVAIYNQGLEQVENQYQAEKRALEGVNLELIRNTKARRDSATTRVETLPGVNIEDVPDNVKGYTDAMADAMLEAQGVLADTIPPIPIGDEVNLSGLEDGLEDAKKMAKDKVAEIMGAIQAKLDEGVNFSVNLGDMRGGTFGGGPLAPGANGAFEALYRIQDVAMNLGKPTEGVDTKKWYQMYFGGMAFEDAVAQATEIVKKFQAGIFTPDVTQYINEDALVNAINMEKIAAASKQAYADALLKAHPELDEKNLNSLLGIKEDAQGNFSMPNMANVVTALQTTLANQAGQSTVDVLTPMLNLNDPSKVITPDKFGAVVPLISTGLQTAIDADTSLETKGASAFSKFETGFVNRAKNSTALRQVIEAMVLDALNED